MRQILYGLAAAAMGAGALGLALLPRLTEHWLWFGFLGASFSAIGGGGWLLAGASAGDWPRPRAGWVLMAGGAVGALVNLVDLHPIALAWAGAEGVIGALLTFPLFPVRRGRAQQRRGPVQAPVSRRQEGR